jgi:acetyl esterase/lipase
VTVSLVLQIALAAIAWVLAGWSLLTVARIPSYLLWKPAVAATEWGHWLAGAALSVAAAGFLAQASNWAVVTALFAAVLFATPTVRAFHFGPRAEAAIRQRLPASPAPSTHRLSRSSAISVLDLLHISIPRVEQASFVYSAVSGMRLTLDLYQPMSLRARSPLLLFVHGGSWNSGSSDQLSGMNRYFAAAGHAVAAINYRLAPTFRFPAPIEDISRALSFLEEHGDTLEIDPTRVVLVGRSSGGHLALMAAYTLGWPGIRGVVALYAPTDLRWSWTRPSPKRIMDSNGVLRGFIGGGLEEAHETFDRASPIRFVGGNSPPTLLIHGRKDMMVSPEQSRRLAAELERANVRHLHLELPWGNHGMDANLAGPSGQVTLYAMERFLASVSQ